jgi:hypothetical protein
MGLLYKAVSLLPSDQEQALTTEMPAWVNEWLTGLAVAEGEAQAETEAIMTLSDFLRETTPDDDDDGAIY